MEKYYKNLIQGNTADKYTSLREVQLEMIGRSDDLANPYYWAPFVFMGNKISQ